MKPVHGPALAAFEIDTERLHLRPLQMGDEALFHALYTDPDSMRFIAPPLSAAQAARYFRSTVAGMQTTPIRWLSLAMLRKQSQQPVGICGVSDFDAAARRLEVGILLTAEARSQGIAREGLTALMNRLFELLPVDELTECRAGYTLRADAERDWGFCRIQIWSAHRPSVVYC